jgi:Family of unknown function (DUF6709)
MDTWVHQQLRAMYRRRVIAWCFVLGCAVLFAVAQSRYIKNFASGPFEVGQAELDAIGDVSTAPHYFVSATGSKAIETGIQQITTRKRYGVETGRSVSAAYYVLVVGDRLLVVKRAVGTPTTVEGELATMPAELDRHLFNTPQMQAIRGRFYPYYLDDSSFRTPGYIGGGVAIVLAALFVWFGLPAWRYARDVSSHPVVKRVALWGDPLSTAVEARREADSPPRYKGGGWRVGDKYLIRSAPFAFDLLRLSDLLWAYKKVTKHSMNFIPTGKSYAGILVCYGGAAEVTGKEKNVDALLAFAAERAPWAILGYSDDLKKLSKQKTQEFCAAVEQRKRELASQAHK